MMEVGRAATQLLWSAVFLFVAIWLWELLFSPLRKFPGPFLAKFTDLWRALATARYKADVTHRDLHEKYGTAVRIGPNCISLNDPSLIRTIYATKNPWLKSDMYRPNDVLINGQRLQNVFNTQDEDWHTKHMKPIRGFFTMTKVLEMESLIDETLTKFLDKIGKEFTDGTNKGKTCPGDDWLGYFAWDVTANISFGRHYGFIDQGKDVDNLIVDSTKGLYYFAPVSQIPWIDRLLDKNPIVRIGPKPTLTGVMYSFGVVAQYQQQGMKPGAVENCLDKYIRMKQDDPEFVNDAQIVNWLMVNILAGGDTTSAIMRAVVYHLSKNPEVYQKLTAELDAANLSTPAKWREIKDLPYLDAVLREGMRINPGIAMIPERVVPASGFTLPDGRFIPAGTKVGINPGVACRDVGVFGDDTNEYNPNRWLKKNGENEEDFQNRTRRMRDVVDFIFGGGGRICMGRQLAILEIWKLFATLYSVYDMRLVDPKHEWTYRNAWFVYQYNMPCKITRRE